MNARLKTRSRISIRHALAYANTAMDTPTTADSFSTELTANLNIVPIRHVVVMTADVSFLTMT